MTDPYRWLRKFADCSRRYLILSLISMFRIIPPSGESSSITTNSYGNNAGIMRRGPQSRGGSPLSRPSPQMRNHLVASFAEFAATFMYLFFAFALHLTTVATLPPNEPPPTLVILTICFAYSFFYGFLLLIYVLTSPGVVPGMFNPAIALASVLAGGLDPIRALFLLPVQILAGISAAAVVKAILPGDLFRIQPVLGPVVTAVQGLFVEILTSSLIIVTALVVTARTGALNFLAPTGIGIAIFTASFVGIAYTGPSMNPIQAFGLCAVNSNFPSYHWIYWAGPFIGALLPATYYRFMQALSGGLANEEDALERDLGGPDKIDPPGHGVAEEQTRMIPQAPTPPKIRKTTVTRVSAIQSPGARSPTVHADTVEAAYYDKDGLYLPYRSSGMTTPPKSPYRTSRDERRVSSGRHSDMDRYARARELEEVMQ